MRARLSAMATAVVLAVMTALPAAAAAAGGEPVPAAPYGVQLLGQVPWVHDSGQFTLHLAVNAASPATDALEVKYFPQLINRTNFDSAANGQVRSYPYYTARPQISKLPVDPAGGVDVDIPVNLPAPAGSPIAPFTAGHSGVWPIQVSVLDAQGRPEGPALTTFLVYAAGNNTPLSVAVVVPFDSKPAVGSAGRIQAPSGGEADRLGRLATVLNGDGSVHASVLTSPLTLTSLQTGAAAGSATDRATVANLAGVPGGGVIQVLPNTYSQVAPGDLIGAGLSAEADQQFGAAASTLQAAYGTPASSDTWVVNGPLDGATLGFLAAHHASTLIVPSSDLTPYSSPVTFASATWLQYGFSRFKVVAADPQLSSDFTANETPVLAANQLLAEMAMIQTEQPGKSRGVVALPPSGWSASPDFVATLLAGLSNNPLLAATTASGIFSSLPAPDVTRYLASPQPAPSRAAAALAGSAGRIQAARRDLTGLSSVLPDQATVAALGNQILAAEAENISPAARAALLGAVESEKGRLTRRISLPGSTSITLTATKGQLPITILSSAPGRPRVQLVLSSQRLIFRPAGPPDGSCTVTIPTKEVCTFFLNAQNTTLKVPVETRSSGVFPLVVSLYSPDGMLQLAKNQDTVRSTAVSGVGLILIVVAVLSLAVWWGRDLRHGRRPGKMAPAPDGGTENDVHLGDDPLVGDFFKTQPPQYDRSGRRTG